MLRTSSVSASSSWIFQHFLKLSLNIDVELKGQNITIKSPFNKGDKKPSFYLKYNSDFKEYFFKDFSVNYEGDSKMFVRLLYNLNSIEAENLIVKHFKQSGSVDDFPIIEENLEENRTKVIEYTIGNWTNLTYDYWLKYGINKFILDFYNVKVLEQIVVSTNKGVFKLRIAKCYGYFDKYGELYKIYSPESEHKFFYVKDFISGTCQLTYQSNYLLILSSLKDMMSFKSFNISNLELVAGNSETTIIPRGIINSYKVHYKKIGVLFDNDKAGKDSADKYFSNYGIGSMNLNLSKDVSDSVRDYGKERTRNELIFLLKNFFKNE